MKLKYSLFTLTLWLFCSCSQQDISSPHVNIVDIKARDEGLSHIIRPIIYRIKVPKDWIQKDASPDESVVDTTKPIVEFFIVNGEEKIRIAIHNFPSTNIDQRIPTTAQINRWKKQFQSLVLTSLTIKPQAFAGYYGFLFEATGQMQGTATSILGWILQLAPEHYQALSHPAPKPLALINRQMRSDITIKAVGPKIMMDKHREEIISFARSFQLIDDLP